MRFSFYQESKLRFAPYGEQKNSHGFTEGVISKDVKTISKKLSVSYHPRIIPVSIQQDPWLSGLLFASLSAAPRYSLQS